jgi:hypothetical protein
MGGEQLASFKNSLSINFFSLKMFSFCSIGYVLLNTLKGHVFFISRREAVHVQHLWRGIWLSDRQYSTQVAIVFVCNDPFLYCFEKCENSSS